MKNDLIKAKGTVQMTKAKSFACGALALAAGLLAHMACAGAEGADGRYAPAPSPLMTEWGEKVTPENAWREYPRPQMVRAGWTNLNGLWDYAVTKGAEAFPAKWDGQILVPFALESALSGVGRLLDPSEILWYRRTFEANPRAGRRLLLWFEQSDFRTQVFVNGREAGLPHEGGFLPFSYDVTGLVREGANELLVMVWDATNSSLGGIGKQNAKPHGCMYTRVSGLYGTVWLEEVPETHIAGYRVTPDIDAGTVSFSFDVAGSGRAAMPVEVRIGELRAVTDGNGEVCVRMPEGFKLWSPEEPNLYDFTATCGEDAVRGYFGMRKFDMAPDAKGVLRFRLNNSFRYILGTLDQGWWPDGLLTPPSEEAMAWDVKLLKDAGFDMMRKHIKVEPRRYYALCDRLGILVVQDMPSGWGNLEARYGFYRRELKEMIDHLYNVPSIVMWVPYNEAWGQPGPVQTRNTLLWTRRYDPTRLVDGPSGWRDYEGGDLGCGNGERNATRHMPPGVEEAGDAVDRHDYGAKPGMAPVNPRRASFLGEFGGIGCRVDGHLWTTNAWGYGDTGKDADRKAFETKYVNLMDHVGGLAAKGLAGSVYTQTTDVEGEINGLVTYDRKVVKFDPTVLAEAHRRVREAAEKASRGENE
ncbi:MAG TPA: beta-galactosidase [Verrucomicrobia bacterium]|nr:beta-galactosidase [Verrucomicrobiota bacterium]